MSNKKILVLGSEPHSKLVTAYAWDNLPKLLNVADYDIIILNLVPFLIKEFAKSIDLDTLPRWSQFARFLFSENSEVIAIGIPTSDLSIGNNPYQTPTWWLPVVPTTTIELGEQIKNILPEFGYYFRFVKKWPFHVSSEFIANYPGPELYIHAIDSNAERLSCVMFPIAETRFGRFVAFNLSIELMRRNFSGEPFTILQKSGNIIWLPPTTEITHYEAVNLILRERYGLPLDQTAPAWIESYKLPNQLPIENEIARIDQEIQRLTVELSATQHQLQTATRFRKLLYEQGEDALEPVVRDALRELGAQVIDPPPRQGREDGRLVDPAGRNGMLEIKGRTGTLRLTDVRQLNQWVQDAIIEEGWIGQGILVANLDLDKPPAERDEIFPSNCIQAAQRTNLCLMTTTQLFNALCAHQRGELDVTAFWDTIFNTKGVLPDTGAETAGSPLALDGV